MKDNIIKIDFDKKENPAQDFFDLDMFSEFDFVNEEFIHKWQNEFKINFQDASDAILDLTTINPFE